MKNMTMPGKREKIIYLVILVLSLYLVFYDVFGNWFGYKIRIAGGILTIGITVYLCVVFRVWYAKGISTETLFLLSAVPLLLFSIFSYPIGMLPDEPAHLQRIYLISTGQIFPSAEHPFEIPEGFLDGIGSSHLSALFSEQFNTISKELVESWSNFATGVYPVPSYLVQALSMKLMMAITDNRIVVFYGVRVLTGLFVLLGIYLAIRMVPEKFKMLIFLIFLIPGTIRSITSASADGMAILYVMLLVSFVIRYQTEETKFSLWHNLALFLLTFMTASSKFLYFPLIFTVFAIPCERWGSKKKKNATLGVILLLDVLLILLWVGYCYETYVRGTEGTAMDGVLPQLQLVLTRPLYYACVLLHTGVLGGWYYLADMFCAYTNICDKEIIAVLGMLFFVLGYALLVDGKEHYLEKNERILFLICSTVSVFALCTALYAEYTSYGRREITGIQGRYFIPLLYPVLSAFITSKKVNPAQIHKYHWMALFLSLVDVNILVNNLAYTLF